MRLQKVIKSEVLIIVIGLLSRGLIPDCIGETNFAVIKSFGYPEQSAVRPEGGVIEGSDGILYGVTVFGGSSPASSFYANAGTIYRINKDRTGYRVLHSFSRSDGAGPHNRLIEGSDGRLYGTTRGGGLHNRGTVFRLAREGSDFETIHHFAGAPADGFEPGEGVIEAFDGSLYGSTIYGGTSNAGMIFRMNKDGTGYSAVHSFATYPARPGPLVQGSDQQIYGTAAGGALGPRGGIFRIPSDGGPLVPVYTFASDDCRIPGLSLEASDGALYGTTSSIDGTNAGCIFKINKDGTGLTTLKRFLLGGPDGGGPVGVIEGGDGYLYGNTSGTVFRIGKDGQSFSTLHEFGSEGDGALPYSAVIQATDGGLFGTTIAGPWPSFGEGTGMIYTVQTNGTDYRIVHSFVQAGGDGKHPTQLIRGSNQTLHGVTQSGTSSNAFGLVFQMSLDGTEYHQVFGFTDPIMQGSAPLCIVRGANEDLYGMTQQGGPEGFRGVIFRLATNGAEFRVLHSFDPLLDGSEPKTLIAGSDQRLYGTTTLNGPAGAGTVFSLQSDGTEFRVLRSFSGSNIGRPGPLIEGRNGYLYGAASYGVFKLSKDGLDYDLLHDFRTVPGDGAGVVALTEGRDGNLYGAAAGGGDHNGGIIFRMTPAGTDYRILYHFPTNYALQGLIEGSDGVLYGSTYFGGRFNAGTVFRINRDGSNYSVIRDLDRANRGPRSATDIIEGADGALYVPTIYGGQMDLGTICRLLAPPEILQLRILSDRTTQVVISGLSGRRVRLEGSPNLLDWTNIGSATSVNGTVTINDPNAISLRHQFYRAVGE